MKKVYLLFTAIVISLSSQAQSFILDWGSSFSPAWTAGATSRTATNIGGSGINCTVAMSISGSGAFDPGYPQVNVNNANNALFEVQSSSDAIEIDQNLGNRTSSSVTTFSFSSAVQNLQFGISDVDFPGGGTPWDYVDVVTITGTGPSGAVVPVLTKFNPASNIFNIAGNVATANTAGAGNVASLNQNAPDQNGTLFVDFGTGAITSVTITYGVPNIAGVRTNPRLQAIAIGNISFLPQSNLPVSFTDFGARVQQQKTVLYWHTASASNNGYIYVERSADGRNWQSVPGITPFLVNSSKDYTATDAAPLPGISYYRLKEITAEGTIYLSRIVRISFMQGKAMSGRVYPNPFVDQFNLELNWPANEMVELQLYNTWGQLVVHQRKAVTEGFQVIPVSLPPGAAKGSYYLRISNPEKQSLMLTLQNQ
jgi:Secretion system C-terminal sorting domain